MIVEIVRGIRGIQRQREIGRLKRQHELEVGKAQDAYRHGWEQFRGESLDEIYNIFKLAALLEITQGPVSEDDFYAWNSRCYAFVVGLTAFEHPIGQQVVFNWLRSTTERFLQQDPEDKKGGEQYRNGLNMVNPDRRTLVQLEGSRLVVGPLGDKGVIKKDIFINKYK